MKKIFTLIAALVLTVATFAADHKPSVTLKNLRNYEVVIDGRSYRGNGIMQINLQRGRNHTIKVYELTRGGFGLFNIRSKRLMDAETFRVGQRDLDISIDFRGQIRIIEERRRDRDWNDRRYDNDRDHRDDRDWNRNF